MDGRLRHPVPQGQLPRYLRRQADPGRELQRQRVQDQGRHDGQTQPVCGPAEREPHHAAVLRADRQADRGSVRPQSWRERVRCRGGRRPAHRRHHRGQRPDGPCQWCPRCQCRRDVHQDGLRCLRTSGQESRGPQGPGPGEDARRCGPLLPARRGREGERPPAPAHRAGPRRPAPLLGHGRTAEEADHGTVDGTGGHGLGRHTPHQGQHGCRWCPCLAPALLCPVRQQLQQIHAGRPAPRSREPGRAHLRAYPRQHGPAHPG